MDPKRVFVSCDNRNDLYHKHEVVNWNTDQKHAFDYCEPSPGVPPEHAKQVITRRINAASRFLCLVGEHTHKSRQACWEIEQAVFADKKISAVLIRPEYKPPAELLRVGASWATDYSYPAICVALI